MRYPGIRLVEHTEQKLRCFESVLKKQRVTEKFGLFYYYKRRLKTYNSVLQQSSTTKCPNNVKKLGITSQKEQRLKKEKCLKNLWKSEKKPRASQQILKFKSSSNIASRSHLHLY